jgi:ribosomal-protein-alanine N-acetyltransferase
MTGKMPRKGCGAGAAVLLGSSRGDGNTRQVVDLALAGQDVEVIDLGQLDIGLYDYGHANAADDFLPLVERLASKSLWVMATPVYWYAMSGQMKVFFDRLSDLVTIRKARGRSLKGKTVAVIASGTDIRLPEGFEAPFRQTCDYLGMRYTGALYVQFVSDGRPARDYSRDVARFQADILSQGPGTVATGRMLRPGVRLERPSVARRSEFIAAVRASKALHGRFVSPPADAAAYAAWLKRLRSASFEGHLVIDAATGEPAGVINLSEIVRGSFQSAYLGYYALVPHAGSGRMSAGMRLVLRRAFSELGLHRVEANIQPDNTASMDLVRRLGFVREGYSRRYLKIRGRWQDHERWALTREDWRSGS